MEMLNIQEMRAVTGGPEIKNGDASITVVPPSGA
jgi:hypothetical protein